MDSVYITLFKRPYVVAFFVSWLVLSLRHMGWRASLRFFIIGFGVAWLSEASSIRTGFPYGWYFYRYENLKNEWLLAGVPVWDSASYVFLTYAGLCVAISLLARRSGSCPSAVSNTSLAFLTSCLTTLLDVIIDPIAYQGKKWFLGDIYYYPYPGFYFHVPMANFAGWFLVTFLISFLFLITGKKTGSLVKAESLKLGIVFYMAVALFNIAIAFWIGATALGIVSASYMIALGLCLKKSFFD